ncbi:hypothetical protein CRUP_030045 [Coryphaenoides rupestris]|nr:hypothetical protein CRUP_030045 [Coryphaenoides rupestris]
MGQGLAVFLCGTAISSQYLASDYHVNTPMLQSLLNYALLCATYTPMLFFRTAMVGADLMAGRDQGSSLLFAAFALCMYTLYSCMPVVVKLTSATAFSALYIISLVVILVGFVTFNAVPTITHTPSPPSSIAEEGGCHDNPAINLDDDDDDAVTNKQEIELTIITPTTTGEEGQGDRREGDEDPRSKMDARTPGKGHVQEGGYGSFSDVVNSTKM